MRCLPHFSLGNASREVCFLLQHGSNAPRFVCGGPLPRPAAMYHNQMHSGRLMRGVPIAPISRQCAPAQAMLISDAAFAVAAGGTGARRPRSRPGRVLRAPGPAAAAPALPAAAAAQRCRRVAAFAASSATPAGDAAGRAARLKGLGRGVDLKVRSEGGLKGGASLGWHLGRGFRFGFGYFASYAAAPATICLLLPQPRPCILSPRHFPSFTDIPPPPSPPLKGCNVVVVGDNGPVNEVRAREPFSVLTWMECACLGGVDP